LKAIAPALPSESPALEATDSPCTSDSGRSPGVDIPEVFSPAGTTRRPFGGAKVRAGATCGVAEAAETGAESDPGRAIRKPIVEPAKTASRSQQTVRRGTK
jgi:hypothetical protein